MPAIAVHHTATEDSPWDGPAAVAAMPNDEAVLHYCHAWEAAGAGDQKGDYKFPHAKTKGGPANVPGCRNGLARLSGSTIPGADKPGVRSHLQAHLDDANKKSDNAGHVLVSAGFQNLVRRARPAVGGDRPGFRFATEDDGTATLHVMGPIGGSMWGGGTSAEDFVAQLAEVTGPLNVRINSGGGDAFDGITMMNALRDHPHTVNGTVAGMAASAASIIAMGCDSLAMAPGSQLMIHRASVGVYGNAAELKSWIAELERMDTSIAELYQARAGGDLADWETAMADETWYTPKQAVAAGLADHIAEPAAKAGNETDNRYHAGVGPGTPAAVLAGPATNPFQWTDEDRAAFVAHLTKKGLR